MQIKRLPVEQIELNTGQIDGLPANPRQWTRDDIDRIANSLRETPELFEMRPCIVFPHGGDNQRWNLVYSCRSCNSKKHDKTMEEYAITTGDVYGISNRYDAFLARVYAPYMEQLNKR